MFALFAALSLTLLAFGGYAGGTLAQLGLPVNPILIGAAGTAVAAVVAAIRRPYLLRGVAAPIVLWATMIAGFVSASQSTTYGDGKVTQLLTLTPLTVFAGVVLLGIPEVRSRLLWCIVGWGALVAALQFLNPDTAGNPLTISAEGSSYLNYGRAVAAAAVVLLVLAVRRRASALPLLLLGAGFMWLALSSGSRGPVIAAVVAVAAGLAVSRLPAGVTITGLIGVFLAVQFIDLEQFLPERLQSFDDNSTQVRVYMLEIAVQQFRDSPLGAGWGELEPYMAGVGPDLAYPHNVFIEVAAEAGLLALAGFVGYLLYSLIGQYKASTTGPEAALFALTVFMIGNASVSGDINSNRGLHLLLAAGIAAWTIRRLAAQEVTDPAAEAAGSKNLTRGELARGRWT
ncbi:MAG: O-antigen ligase family protein [Dietzia cercidiphylli]